MNGGGGGGTTDYSDLTNKPQINSVTLAGNKSLDALGAQKKLTAGDNITISDDGTISASGGGGGGNDVYTITIVTKSTGGQDAAITVTQYVNGAEVATHDYKYSELTTPVTFHDFMTIGYDNMRYTYTLLRASFTNASGYSKSWGFETEIAEEQGCFYTAPTN